MFTFGAQQSREPVALLLGPTAREHFMQMVIRSAFRPPRRSEMANHHAHLRLDAVLGIVVTQETDDIPMRRSQFQPFAPGQFPCEFLRPLAAIDEIPLAVGGDAPAVNIDTMREGVGCNHRDDGRSGGQMTMASRPRASGR